MTPPVNAPSHALTTLFEVRGRLTRLVARIPVDERHPELTETVEFIDDAIVDEVRSARRPRVQ